MARDLRKFSRQTNFRFILGGIILIFVIGIGLIYIFYGTRAAITGIICMIGGLTPVILIMTFLWAMGQLVKYTRDD